MPALARPKRASKAGFHRDGVQLRLGQMQSNWSLPYLMSDWLIRLVMLVYVPQRRSAAASRTWLLLIFLLPWPGLVIYALFGRIYVSKRRIGRQIRASHHIRAVQAQMGKLAYIHPKLPPHDIPLAAFAARLGDFEP